MHSGYTGVSNPELFRTLGLPPYSPLSLDAIRDTGKQPPYTLSVLCQLAILGSPTQRLLVQDIFNALMHKFTYYRNLQDAGVWKNSVRSVLTNERCFVQVSRSQAEPGRGDYWTLSYLNGPRRP
ncbi:uncharacterized protein BXZ73DRAFT_96384 [Epithele typhae]|uniref:uncharacterized protein n=1 Tax=Epithele typhae TaxID=378194 RepID=UPI002008A02F|nr:uncharacterized protein BXZ73DRAFT_96384 [Epithele typhae]KAH9945394.1 hypothetical protein BXZ73DRAFT_96384 [Epithele typhae]